MDSVREFCAMPNQPPDQMLSLQCRDYTGAVLHIRCLSPLREVMTRYMADDGYTVEQVRPLWKSSELSRAIPSDDFESPQG